MVKLRLDNSLRMCSQVLVSVASDDFRRQDRRCHQVLGIKTYIGHPVSTHNSITYAVSSSITVTLEATQALHGSLPSQRPVFSLETCGNCARRTRPSILTSPSLPLIPYPPDKFFLPAPRFIALKCTFRTFLFNEICCDDGPRLVF